MRTVVAAPQARIAITTMGTRGDVQPYLALAKGLMAAGHHVLVAAPEQFASLAQASGVPFHPLPGELIALLDAPEGRAAVAGSIGFGAGVKLLKHVGPLTERLVAAEWQAMSGFAPDLIVGHPKSFATPHMAEALGCGHMLASPLPGFTPTAAFPSPLLPLADLGPLNRASHVLGTHAANLIFARLIRRFRSETLGLGGRRARGSKSLGTLYAYSPHVVPAPGDWGPDVLVSGYWFLDSPDWRPDAALAAFLEAGPPPVYMGFGSMPGGNAASMTDTIVAALALTGKRGLVATGGGALAGDRAAPHIHTLAGAPHERLFPLVSGTLHHGGAGTTGAALRAGKPTAICPFFGDQPFWARRVAALGVGPKALDRHALSVEAVAEALVAMDDPEMVRRAESLGSAIRGEDGVASAVAFIEGRLSRCGPAADPQGRAARAGRRRR